jgi:glutathione S-transferase
MSQVPVGSRVLWGVGSPRTMRAHWALHELDIPYETKPILSRNGETQTPQYSQINPRQKIPLFQDGDFTISESCAIVYYLAETYAKRDRPLIPFDGRQRARLHEWNYFISMELDATTLYPMRRHSLLKHIYGDAPAAVESSRAYFLKQLDHVDQTLQASGHFLMGEDFTIADILLTTCLTWAIALEVPVHDNCRAYLQRVMARPAYQTASVANQRRS